jgi:hypothetical protein
MRHLDPTLRRGMHLAFLCAFLFATRAHAAGRVIADFDGDGRGDHVTLDAVDARVVRIWFSSTRTTEIIRSPQPLRDITAVDLNGDRHPELVASNRSHGLQVWVRAHAGFRRYAHKRKPPLPRDLSYPERRRVNDDAGSDAAAIGGAKLVPMSAAVGQRRRSLIAAVRRNTPDVTHAARSALPDSPFAPRPPPALTL